MLKIGGSVKDTLDRNRGVGPGFDVLRFGLAAIIFIGHLKALTGHVGLSVSQAQSALITPWVVNWGWDGWYRPFQVSYVPAFFALSGFLVMGSAVRTRATQTFLAYRALRIFPALFVELIFQPFYLVRFSRFCRCMYTFQNLDFFVTLVIYSGGLCSSYPECSCTIASQELSTQISGHYHQNSIVI